MCIFYKERNIAILSVISSETKWRLINMQDVVNLSFDSIEDGRSMVAVRSIKVQRTTEEGEEGSKVKKNESKVIS